jgi:hypothetical protein
LSVLKPNRHDLANDLVLPTVLFAALGAMSWAVRGCRGFGGGAGCIFAGVLWGAAWWYCARDPAREPSRRYASGWIVLALTLGMGIAGQRGWMQWPHFFAGQLSTNWDRQEFVPISRGYGFLWQFLSGMPWAGLGACLVAWCGSRRETRVWHWMLRIACGLGAGAAARALFDRYPQYILPLYSSLEFRYQDPIANPGLQRLINDCGAALTHLGYYLGFLLFEGARRDRKNVVLIVSVGVVNGAGWAALQNWTWAPGVWRGADFNWWRCWESSAGISIGVAYGIAYFLVNRRVADEERAALASRRAIAGPNFEWLLIFSGLAAVLSVFVGPLAGGRGSIGVSDLNLPPHVAAFLRDHLDTWGSVYFAVVLLFGAAYYFRYRGTAVGEMPTNQGRKPFIANMEVGALLLVAALIAPLFAGSELRQAFLDLMRRVSPGAAAGPRQSDVTTFRILYVAAVAALGLAWYLARRKRFDEERRKGSTGDGDPNLERLGVYLGLLAGLGLSLLNGLNGWFRIDRGHPRGQLLWHVLGPVYLLGLVAILAGILFRPLPRGFRGNLHPHAYGLMWLVLIVQNAIAQLVTGPPSQWNEMAFSIYYVLLFTITGLIVFHTRARKAGEPPPDF